jgi:hypothetical protein
MPIPNVSSLSARISAGAEGGHEFARFLKALLGAHYSGLGQHMIAPSDASGDFRGLDAFVEGGEPFPELITGFQFKFYPARLNKRQKGDIQRAVENSILQNECLRELILVTPEDFMKEGQEWFAQLNREFTRSYLITNKGNSTSYTFGLQHWGHTKIIELALRHQEISRHYFPELFPRGEGTFRLSSAGIDCKVCNWKSSGRRPFSYVQHLGMENPDLASDPVFDFQFVNSTDEIILLRSIEIHIEKVGTILKGIGAEHFLKSIGRFEFMVDFSRRVNVFELPDPLIVRKNAPLRFSLQLKEFAERAPGNFAYLKFWFRFDRYSCATESFYLSF